MLNTPFRRGGELDIEGLQANLAYAREAGVAGFLANGLAAEVGELTQAERETVVRAAVACAGQTPVIAGLGAASDAGLTESASRYLDLGCRGLMVNGAGMREGALLPVLAELDRFQPGFLMLQDWDTTGQGIPVSELLGLVNAIPSLRWLKVEVVGAGPKYSELLDQAPEKLRVAGGWAVMQMVDGLERGVHAFMPTALHRTYVRIHELFTAGRKDECSALFARLLPILEFSNQRLDISVAFFKRLLHAQGIYETDRCRLPTARFDSHQAAAADRLIALALGLENADFF